MLELLNYHISDFILYAPQTYWRLLQSHNEAFWPLQLLVLPAGLALIGLLWCGTIRARRIAALVLAVLWLWVAYSFFWQRYASIQIAAPTFAILFAVQAFLLILYALLPTRFIAPDHSHRIEFAAILGIGIGTIFFPLANGLLGRQWTEAETFLLFPDPLAIATIGLLAASGPFLLRFLLLPLPFLWCTISSIYLIEIGAPDRYLMLASILLILFIAIAQTVLKAVQARAKATLER